MRREVNQESLILLRSRELCDCCEAVDYLQSVGGKVVHCFGNVLIGEVPTRLPDAARRKGIAAVHPSQVSGAPGRFDETAELGLAGWNLRRSPEFAAAKRKRPGDGLKWDCGEPGLQPDGPVAEEAMLAAEPQRLPAHVRPPEDMSLYLIGSVAVGIIIVEGPTSSLQFSRSERAKVVAEVQSGLGWLAKQEKKANVSWSYEVKTVRLKVKPTTRGDRETLWRNPTMEALGYSPDWNGVRQYVADLRNRLGTRWGYVTFFTKYPTWWFAYAGKPRVVMQYWNDGWGVDNIDRVFVHETGHIFGCPDEYAASQCNCTATYGFLHIVNGNCETCAKKFVSCIMSHNTYRMCEFTKGHLGWRDSDNDGVLDPDDPALNVKAHLLRRLARRHPELAQWFVAGDEVSGEDLVPLSLLRRVLTDAEMRKVEAALAREEEAYLELLMKKLSGAAQKVRRTKGR